MSHDTYFNYLFVNIHINMHLKTYIKKCKIPNLFSFKTCKGQVKYFTI